MVGIFLSGFVDEVDNFLLLLHSRAFNFRRSAFASFIRL